MNQILDEHEKKRNAKLVKKNKQKKDRVINEQNITH